MNDIAFRHLIAGADAFRPDDNDASSFAVLKSYGDFASFVQDDLVSRVDGARSMGLTWEQIGAALGVSKQAAHERFASRMRRGDLNES